MLVLKILQQIPFFSSLSEEDHLQIIENIRLQYFPAGHIIFREGEGGDTFYIIRSGKVKVYKEKKDYEQLMTVLKENDFFGEMALISDQPRTATVKALEDCEVFSVRKSDLYELLKEKPEIAKKISETFLYRTKENRYNSEEL